MPTETVHFPDGRPYVNLVNLEDTSQRIPINKAVSEIWQVCEANEQIAKILYNRLQIKYNQ